ncbi:MAG: ELM1/GtrOC1 family putative glycosyltransferase [Candidatus Ratteibacteria bacterium]
MRILVLDDGNIGNFVQSLGVAKKFPESEITIYPIEFIGPRYKLPGRKGSYPVLPKFLNFFCFFKLYRTAFFLLKIFLKKRNHLLKKKYDIVINTGSLFSSVNLIISKIKKCKSVQIMLPSFIPLKEFDFLILPYHDYLKLKNKNLRNLIVLLGAPNLIDDKVLNEESFKLERLIGDKNKKIIGLLIGGDDQNYKIDKEWVDKILSVIYGLKEDFDFLITVSKRTNNQVIKYLERKLKENKEVKYFENPLKDEISHYKGILGLSDIIFVSEDSINMISEALTSNKKVFILGVKRKKKKLIFDYTIRKIEISGYGMYIPYEDLTSLKERLNNFQKKEKYINEAEKCVQEILARLN